MPQLLADRFVRAHGVWIDIGTGCAARLRVLPAGPAAEQLAWNTRCATLANLRHPLINPLIDYGWLDRKQLFEAYVSHASPLRLTARTAERLIAHALRFLAAHDVRLTPSELDPIIRSIERTRVSSARPIGVVLQQRPVHTAIDDVLRVNWPPGPCVVSIEGPNQSGLRTTRLLAVRAARVQGYLPIDAATVQVFPWLVEYAARRHVCVFMDRPPTTDGRIESAAKPARQRAAPCRYWCSAGLDWSVHTDGYHSSEWERPR